MRHADLLLCTRLLDQSLLVHLLEPAHLVERLALLGELVAHSAQLLLQRTVVLTHHAQLVLEGLVRHDLREHPVALVVLSKLVARLRTSCPRDLVRMLEDAHGATRPLISAGVPRRRGSTAQRYALRH